MPGDYSGGAKETAGGDQPFRRIVLAILPISASCRLQHDHRHQRAMYLSLERDLETRVSYSASCVAIPVAIAGEQLRQRHNCILYPCCKSLLRSHMLHQQQCTSRLQDTHHLLEAALGIGDRTKNQRRHNAIKRPVSKGQRLYRCSCKSNRHSCRLQTFARIAQHYLVRFNGLHPLDLFRLIVREVKSCPYSYLQHHTFRLADTFPTQWVHETALRQTPTKYLVT